MSCTRRTTLRHIYNHVHHIYHQVSYTAHALTLEDYMPLALSRDLSGPQALKQHASALGATLLLCWELIRRGPCSKGM